jgi:hypothetical protein
MAPSGREFPTPQLSGGKPSERDLNLLSMLLATAVPDSHRRKEIASGFAQIDAQVLRNFLVLCEDYKWLSAIQSIVKSMYVTRASPQEVEYRVRHALVAAPIVGQIDSYGKIQDLEGVLRSAFGNQYRWGTSSEWTTDTEVKARGCLLAHYIASNWTSGVLGTSEEDAQWMGENADNIMPHIPQLIERKACTRESMELLLESGSPSLSSGVL